MTFGEGLPAWAIISWVTTKWWLGCSFVSPRMRMWCRRLQSWWSSCDSWWLRRRREQGKRPRSGSSTRTQTGHRLWAPVRVRRWGRCSARKKADVDAAAMPCCRLCACPVATLLPILCKYWRHCVGAQEHKGRAFSFSIRKGLCWSVTRERRFFLQGYPVQLEG